MLVDQVEVNFEDQDAPKGHSLMLDPSVIGADAAAANDDRDVWCIAAPSQEVVELRTDGDEVECTYGTPGEPGECLVGVVTLPEGPRWLCASAGSGAAGWLAVLTPLAIAGLRRRRDDPTVQQ